jgi:hypothetical protein
MLYCIQIITLRASGGSLEGFIDGFHSSSQPPLYVTGETAASIAQFRLGVVDTGDSSAPSYGSVDIAEILMYDDALTNQELDRECRIRACGAEATALTGLHVRS